MSQWAIKTASEKSMNKLFNVSEDLKSSKGKQGDKRPDIQDFFFFFECSLLTMSYISAKKWPFLRGFFGCPHLLLANSYIVKGGKANVSDEQKSSVPVVGTNLKNKRKDGIEEVPEKGIRRQEGF